MVVPSDVPWPSRPEDDHVACKGMRRRRTLRVPDRPPLVAKLDACDRNPRWSARLGRGEQGLGQLPGPPAMVQYFGQTTSPLTDASLTIPPAIHDSSSACRSYQGPSRRSRYRLGA